MSDFKQKLERIKEARLKLRDKLIEEMKTNPTMANSETLRLLENNISFWEKQTDYSLEGLIKTFNDWENIPSDQK